MTVSVVKKLKSQNVFAGDSAKFEVKLSRADAVGVWKHNDAVIVPSDRCAALIGVFKEKGHCVMLFLACKKHKLLCEIKF